jgi:uncharacterized protein YuzE
MKLTYDQQVDAAYVAVRDPIPVGGVDGTERLDADRNVDYDADDRVIGYELLNVRRFGARLDDLEHRAELAALFSEAGFQERDWSHPISTRVVRRRDCAAG